MRYVFLAMSAIYTSIFAYGWKYSFPTHIETMLWCAASGTMLGTLVAYWAITEYAFSLHPRLQRRFAMTSPGTSRSDIPRNEKEGALEWLASKARSVAACVRTIQSPTTLP